MKLINKEIAAYIPFKLSLKSKGKIKPFLKPKLVSQETIKKILPQLKVSLPKEGSISEQVFSILVNPEIRYGNLDYLNKSKSYLLSLINKLLKEKKPLIFHIAGFPHKMPNPFYTTQVEPDLGELMFLWRLESIARILEQIYPYGVKIVICLEGTVFHYLSMISRLEAQNYQELVKNLALTYDFEHLKFLDLVETHSQTKNWDEQVRIKSLKLYQLYQKGDKEVVAQLKRTWPVIFTTLNMRSLQSKEIISMFKAANKGFKETVKSKYHHLALFAFESSLTYLAYNEIKRESKVIEKAISAGIKMSVVPKLNAFGIWWVQKDEYKLPYYGLPLVKDNSFKAIEYAFDAKRIYNLQPVLIKGSRQPFFFEVV
ncbi:L-tyrosine/L-tryptophan isonitrile synthase family protein [Candidatus Daviesbacteria bacterium]|nr:L-tyrosine/L-tryptophan isonitrile synthase family protein [Candidatus Daviesbacteria bacterium]